MNLVDLAAILPLYINTAIAPTSFTNPTSSPSSFVIIRLLRLVRIVRVFKIIRERQDFLVLTLTLRKSLPVLSMLFYYTLLGTIVVAAVIFQFEQGEFRVTSEFPDGAYLRPTLAPGSGWEVSPFTSIWAALYWSIVTATTLGYGDLYPTTPIGRFIASVWIFCGIVMVAMPIGILGSNFSTVYQEYKEREVELQKLLLNEQQSLRSRSSSRSSKHPSPMIQRQKLSNRRLIPKINFKYLQSHSKICPQSSSQSLPLPSPSNNLDHPSPSNIPHSPSSFPSSSISQSQTNSQKPSREDVGGGLLPLHEDSELNSVEIKRQTLRDLFDLIKQLNQNKSEGNTIERKISEITLILKRQEEEHFSSKKS